MFRYTPSTKAALTAVILIAAAITLTTAQAETYYVKYPGHFAPDGRVQYPFSHLRGALCVLPENNTVEMRGGNYYEFGQFSTPMTITALSGETAEIGRYAQEYAELRVITYNTHLDLDGAKCYDETRAYWLGWNLANSGYDADVVGMQEVWSDDRRDDVFETCGYADEFYGSEKNGRIKNSGLLLMTREAAMQWEDQVSYEWGEGWDWFANKGYIRATFNHDGFDITIFCTHTQSGNGEKEKETRARNLDQLATDIAAWRTVFPEHVVIAVGDFNVPGEEDEYYNVMDEELGGQARTLDGARNEGCGDYTHCTACLDNHLKQRWGDDGEETRLDYILFAPSRDGSVKVVIEDYQWLRFQIPDSEDPIPCGKNDADTRHLSDHDGAYAKLKLYRVN
jgi:endonuclease/exonuclease/phosphatase family metal-dependent hydrolase